MQGRVNSGQGQWKLNVNKVSARTMTSRLSIFTPILTVTMSMRSEGKGDAWLKPVETEGRLWRPCGTESFSCLRNVALHYQLRRNATEGLRRLREGRTNRRPRNLDHDVFLGIPAVSECQTKGVQPDSSVVVSHSEGYRVRSR